MGFIADDVDAIFDRLQELKNHNPESKPTKKKKSSSLCLSCANTGIVWDVNSQSVKLCSCISGNIVQAVSLGP